MAIRERLGTSPSDFLARTNPDTVAQAVRNIDNCMFGAWPTLSEIDAAYGCNTSSAWLSAHITRLSTFSGARNITPEQVRDLAETIRTDYYFLKFTELMLFFHRFKSGHYGKFYGSVDPLAITAALRTFAQERGDLIEQHDREAERAKREQWARNAAPMPESLKQYLEKQ